MIESVPFKEIWQLLNIYLIMYISLCNLSVTCICVTDEYDNPGVKNEMFIACLNYVAITYLCTQISIVFMFFVILFPLSNLHTITIYKLIYIQYSCSVARYSSAKAGLEITSGLYSTRPDKTFIFALASTCLKLQFKEVGMCVCVPMHPRSY